LFSGAFEQGVSFSFGTFLAPVPLLSAGDKQKKSTPMMAGIDVGCLCRTLKRINKSLSQKKQLIWHYENLYRRADPRM
jgi:hypothetical protein